MIQLRKKIKLTLSAVLVMVVGVFFAQTLSNTNLSIVTNQPADITVCGDAITFSISIQNVSTEDVENLVLFPGLPSGVEFVSGSAGIESGAILTEISDAELGLGFVIPTGLSTESGQDIIIINFDAKASCDVITTINSDPDNLINNLTKVRYNLISDNTSQLVDEEPNGSSSYNVLYPALQLFVPGVDQNISLEDPNQVFNRTIKLLNNGNASAEFVSLLVEFDSELAYSSLKLNINGSFTELTPSQTTTTSAQYDINLSSLGISLNPGEELVFIDHATVSNFRPSIQTRYDAKFGCNGVECNGQQTVESYLYITSSGYASLEFSETRDNTFIVPCSEDDVIEIYKLKNNGVGNSPAILDGAYSITANFGVYKEYNEDATLKVYLLELDGANNVISEVDVSDYLVSESNTSSNLYNIDFGGNTFFQNDIDGIYGLDDLDNDGYFDDLLPGREVHLKVKLLPTFNTERIDVSDFVNYSTGRFIGRYFRFQDWQGDLNSLNDPNVLNRFYITAQERYWQGDPDLIQGGQNLHHFKYAAVYQDNFINHDNAKFVAEFTLPDAVSISSVLIDNVELDISSISNSPNFSTIELPEVNFNDTEFDVLFDIDCSSYSGEEVQEINWKLVYEVDENCDLDYLLVDEVRPVVLHCSDCPNFEITQFDVKRNTFGWESNDTGISYKLNELVGPTATVNKVDENTPGITLDAALPNDEIKIDVNGLYNGAETLNSVKISIDYNPYSGSNILEFVEANLDIDGTIYSLVSPSISIDANGLVTILFEKTGIVINSSSTIHLESIFKANPSHNYNSSVDDYDLTFASKISNDQLEGGGSCTPNSQYFEIYSPTFSTLNLSFKLNCYGLAYFSPLYFSSRENLNYFENEFRPVFTTNKILISFPEGYRAASGSTFRIYDYKSYTDISDKITLIGNDIEINLDENQPVFGLTGKYQQYYVNVSSVERIPGHVPSGNYESAYSEFYGDYQFAYNSTTPIEKHYTIQTRLRDISFNEMSLSSNSNQEALSSQIEWPIQLCNNSVSNSDTDGSDYNWIAVEPESNDNSIIFEGAKDQTGNVLPVVFYGPANELNPNGKFMMVKMDDINHGQCKNITLIASYANCVENLTRDFNIYSSYSCDQYIDITGGGAGFSGSILDVFNYEQALNQTKGTIIYKNADLQWTVNNTSTSPVSICATSEFDIDFASTLHGEVSSILITVDIPENVSVNTSEYLYPSNPGSSSTLENANYSYNAEGQLLIDLTSELNINGGLPGYQTGENKAKVKLSFNSICGFDPGQPIVYKVDAYTNCNEFITYTDQRKIYIEGLTIDDISLTQDLQRTSPSTSQVIVDFLNNEDEASSESEFRMVVGNEFTFESILGDITGLPVINSIPEGKEFIWSISDGFLPSGGTKSAIINLTHSSSIDGNYNFYSQIRANASLDCNGTACNFTVSSGQVNDYLDYVNDPCAIANILTTCSPVFNLSASGTGRWTQVSGPSQALFSDLNDPFTEVTFGNPGQYQLRWTSPDSECETGENIVVINYYPAIDVSIVPVGGKPVYTLSHGEFYTPSGTVSSGTNYTSEGGAFYDGVVFDETTNHLYTTTRNGGIWVLDISNNEGKLLDINTPVIGDVYNLHNNSPRSLHIDKENQILYAGGWPGSAANKGGAMWRYNFVTGEAKAFYPGMIPDGGGDAFPNGIGDHISQYGDDIIISITRYNSSLPDGGIYIYNETNKTGRFLTVSSTSEGGAYQVVGQPIPGDKTQSNLMFEYKGVKYLFAGFTFEGIWVYNFNDNSAKVLSIESTKKGGLNEVIGDPLVNNENYALTRARTKIFMNSWEGGSWVYDFIHNSGTTLTKENTSFGGSFEVEGDPMPSNYGAGLAYDIENHVLYLGHRINNIPSGLSNIRGGLWRLDLANKKGELIGLSDVGSIKDLNNIYPVSFDGRSNRVFSNSSAPTPGDGMMITSFKDGIKKCDGESVTIRAKLIGGLGVTYQWYKDNVLLSGETLETLLINDEGVYTVEINRGSCSVFSEGFIVANEDFQHIQIEPYEGLSICSGETGTLSVQSGFKSYQWYLNGSVISGANDYYLELNETDIGEYSVEILTGDDCTAIIPNTVLVTANDLSVTYNSTFNNAVGLGAIQLEITGGVAPFSYQWSDGIENVQNPELLPIGLYDVIITDAAGCNVSLTNIMVGFNNCGWEVDVTKDFDETQNTGDISLSIIGGSGSFSYTWSHGLINSPSQTNLSPDIYTVTITDQNNCSETYYINLTGNCDQITSYNISSSNISCNGESNGTIAIQIPGASSMIFNLYDYFSGEEIDIEPIYLTSEVVYFNQLSAGRYVIGLGSIDCQILNIVNYTGTLISEPELLEATYGMVPDTGTGTGSIDLTVTGGTSPFDFIWTPTLNNVEDPTNVDAGQYDVVITDARGCQTNIDDIVVYSLENCDPNHPQRFTLSLVSATESLCENTTDTGEISIQMDFANSPPFTGVTYSFFLIRNTGDFDFFLKAGGEIVQQESGVVINSNNFVYDFQNVEPSVYPYTVIVSASGVLPTQPDNCLFGSYGYLKNIRIEPNRTPDATFTINEPLVKVGDQVIAEARTNNVSNLYRYEWGDGTSTNSNRGNAGHRYAAGEYTITLTVTSVDGCISTSQRQVRVFDYICESPIPNNGGQFYIDNKTGKIVFKRENCPGNFVFNCVTNSADPSIFDKAISASATTYSDDWSYSDKKLEELDFPEGSNEFERGELGKWKPKNYYSYSTELFDTDKNYSSGTFKVEDFSYQYEDANNPIKWVKSSEVEMYSENGEPLQERNVLGIASAVKFGYDDALPYLTIQNGEYEDGYFESFENSYSGNLEENISIENNGLIIGAIYSHSGKRAAKLNGIYKTGIRQFSKQIKDNGLFFRVWVRAQKAEDILQIEFQTYNEEGSLIHSETPKVVAQIGEWSLIEAYSNNFGTLKYTELRENSDKFEMAIKYTGTRILWIDDIRIQPQDAQMTTYVYDPKSLRLLTIFDDQHFGLYYHYNPEGRLIRKQIETERGLKTVQETHYNVPKYEIK